MLLLKRCFYALSWQQEEDEAQQTNKLALIIVDGDVDQVKLPDLQVCGYK